MVKSFIFSSNATTECIVTFDSLQGGPVIPKYRDWDIDSV